jgi:hypothetical protein
MAKYLRIEPGNDPQTGKLTGSNLLLPADTDLDALADEIEAAFADGTPVTITGEGSDDPRLNYKVILNGRATTHVMVAELSDADL